MNEKSHCAYFELIVSYFELIKPHSVRNLGAQETSMKMQTKQKNVFCTLGTFRSRISLSEGRDRFAL